MPCLIFPRQSDPMKMDNLQVFTGSVVSRQGRGEGDYQGQVETVTTTFFLIMLNVFTYNAVYSTVSHHITARLLRITVTE